MALATRFRGNRLLVPSLLGLGIAANLGREVLFGLSYGGSREIEIFRVAFGLPNTLLQCLGSPFVGVALPLIAAAQALGPDAERALARRVLLVGARGFLGLALLGVLLSPWLTRLMAPGFSADELARAGSQLRWLFGFLAVASLSVPLRARLNARHVLWPGASVSLMISLGLGIAAAWVALQDAETPSSTPLVWGALLGGVVVLLMHAAASARLQGTPLETHAESTDTLSDLLHRPLFAPLLAAAVYQLANVLPRFLDRAYASAAEEGAVAAVEYSYNFLTAPGILLGTSFVMVAYPGFARAIASGHPHDSARRLRRPLGGTALLGALAGVVFFLFGEPLIRLIYERGAYGDTEVLQTASVLQGQALSLPFLVLAMVFSQALLGLGMIRALLLAGVAGVAVRWVWLETQPLTHELSNLGWGHTVTEASSALLLGLLLLGRLRETAAR